MNRSEIQTIKTDSFEIEYFFFGSGEKTLIILPGVSVTSVMLSADAIASGFEAFTQRYTVYVFNHESNIDERYSVPGTAEHIAAAMKQIGICQADIYGASQGGMVAQSLAIHHPELVHALYLGGTLSRQNPRSLDTFGRWMELAQGDDPVKLNHCFYTSLYSPEFYNQNAEVFRTMEQSGTAEAMNRFYFLAKSCREFDCYRDLNKIKCPVFAIGSKKDMVLSGEATQEIADQLGCYCHLYDGYGHASFDEAPDFRPRMLKQLSALD